MEAVIAGVLESHQFSAFSAEGYCACTCDAVVAGGGEGWEECADYEDASWRRAYPCPTITAIRAALA